MNTPFDDIAVKLSEAGMQLREVIDEKLLHTSTFVQVCRVRYQQMYSVSEKSWKRHEEMFKNPQQGTRSITIKEMIDQSLESVEAKLNYFGFIEELNRFGRVFEQKYGVILPEYFKIRFYRNKMIEHSDKYEAYLQSSATGYTYTIGKLIIPFHSGAINTPATSPDAYTQLSAEFQALGVTLPQLDLSMMYKKYSEALFASLGQINPRLENVPKSLLSAMFTYSFPTPINDLEKYTAQLVAWLKTFQNIN